MNFPGLELTRRLLASGLLAAIWLVAPLQLHSQVYGQADHGQPGDPMIQQYLRQETERLEADFLGDVTSADEWRRARQSYLEEYFHMLGLWPLPDKTPLRATITGTLDRGEYFVDLLHYQSRPGLYVTANLYRPAKVGAGERLPAVLYVCGHSARGRNGNKTAYQSHGIWLARHGYICLVVDTLQLGEIAGVHHGTYREERWWWLSRGYTPAGVECWNGVRGIDYLLSRLDVDPERIGVTGISGGGAATFWIAAADERVSVAVPVSGLADLMSYVPNRVVNGHCDCMFLYNTFQWPWTRIAALIAPRPLLFVNSDRDPIFPMDANERIINRLERLYSLFGAGDLVDSVVSIGGHAYRQDIRQASFRFLNTHLKLDPRPVLDSEVDLVTGPGEKVHPIPPEQLRVFPNDTDIPKDALNGRIDEEFVPVAKVELPQEGEFDLWKRDLLARLRSSSFHHFPERIPAARAVGTAGEITSLGTEPGIAVPLRAVRSAVKAQRVLLLVTDSIADPLPPWLDEFARDQDALYVCAPRGWGATGWTRKNPPNYVERSHYLLGRTVDSGRVWDIAAAARYLQTLHGKDTEVHLAGRGTAASLALYAALLEPEIAGLLMHHPPASHSDPAAPVLLNVLRVCDLPDALGMLAPRPVTIAAKQSDWTRKAAAIYETAGARDKLVVKP
jgi:dienelactone hydrolase